MRWMVVGLLMAGLIGCRAPASEVTPAPTLTPLPTATAAASPLPTVTSTQPQSQADANVLFVRAVETAVDGDRHTWTFHVTVAHPDTGWEDYADGWDVLRPDGTAVKPDPDSPFTRLLLHPHETEQPFTRSQSGIQLPSTVTEVTVRAHDIVHGYGGQDVVVDLRHSAETETYRVERMEP